MGRALGEWRNNASLPGFAPASTCLGRASATASLDYRRTVRSARLAGQGLKMQNKKLLALTEQGFQH